MLKFFKNKTAIALYQDEQDPSTLPDVKPVLSMKETIQEIHNSFYSEVDALLASAKVSNSLDSDKQELIDKRNRLVALGFEKTKECVEAQSEIDRLDTLKKENKAKSELIDCINYFTQKYPTYKFITEDSVKKICAKYNLIYGSVSRYIGTVPDENIKHIEDFKINKEDAAWEETMTGMRMTSNAWGLGYEQKTTITGYKNETKPVEQTDFDILSTLHSNFNTGERKSPLEIVAPVKDFDTTGMELKDFKLTDRIILDPIVLAPVVYKNQKHYLVVTAWGLEGSDELVVNQKMN